MSKIYVKLKDRGTIFHDASQEATLTGDKVAEVKKTGKVASALRNGLLVEVDAPAPKKETKPANDGGNTNPNQNAGGEKPTDYSKLKKAELIELLTTRGIEHDKEATNEVLAGLLKADDEAKAGA